MDIDKTQEDRLAVVNARGMEAPPNTLAALCDGDEALWRRRLGLPHDLREIAYVAVRR